jgi:hypothetical protein
MSKVVGIISFILLAPLLAGFLQGLRAVISAALLREDPPPVFSRFQDLYQLYREPWDGPDRREKLGALLFPTLILLGGTIFFAGGNLAFCFFLLVFAHGIRIYTGCFSEALEPDLKIPEMQRDIISLTFFASQLLLAAAGFHCFVRLFKYMGSFMTADIAAVDTAPALYTPAMLIGVIWMLLYGINTDLLLHRDTEEIPGKSKVFFEIGLWYQMVILYAVLFLFNYAGTAFSAVIGIAICLLVWLLELLLHKPHTKLPEPVVLLTLPAILLVASFVNLLILLP